MQAGGEPLGTNDGAAWPVHVEGHRPMDWTFNRAGQWEGMQGAWRAIVIRLEQQTAWHAYVFLATMPGQRYERGDFLELEAARTWCEAEIKRRSKTIHW